MRRLSLALFLVVGCAASASAQIRIAYEAAPIALRGNLASLAGETFTDPDERESASGSHRAIMATIPFTREGAGVVGVRVVYTQFTNEDSGTVTGFPGIFLNVSGAQRSNVLGWALSADIGYDYYNREALSVLGLLPTIGVSMGPRMNLGPIGIEATVGAQTTSIMQGAAVTGRLGIAVGG